MDLTNMNDNRKKMRKEADDHFYIIDPNNIGGCIYCKEDTGTGVPGSSHVVCRKVAEGYDPMDIYHDMLGCTMMEGQFDKELKRLFQRVAIRGIS